MYLFFLSSILLWSYQELVSMIQQEYPDFQRLDDAKNDTSKAWKVPGFKVNYTIFICCMLILLELFIYKDLEL